MSVGVGAGVDVIEDDGGGDIKMVGEGGGICVVVLMGELLGEFIAKGVGVAAYTIIAVGVAVRMRLFDEDGDVIEFLVGLGVGEVVDFSRSFNVWTICA